MESNTALGGGEGSDASIILDAGSSWTTELGVVMAAGEESVATIDLNDGTWTAQSLVRVSMDGAWDSLGTGTININMNGVMDSEYGLIVGGNGVVVLDGGVLRLAGSTTFGGEVRATANGGTILVMAGQVAGGIGRVEVGENVSFANCQFMISFHEGLSPDPWESLDLFDPLGAADLAAILDSAGEIAMPLGWVLDHDTGVLSHLSFMACLEGPDVVATLACRLAYDVDADGDVDLVDFGALQRARGE